MLVYIVEEKKAKQALPLGGMELEDAISQPSRSSWKRDSMPLDFLTPYNLCTPSHHTLQGWQQAVTMSMRFLSETNVSSEPA